MPVAAGTRRQIRYCPEGTFATLPASPVFKELRNTGGQGISIARNQLQTKEFRPDRGVPSVRLGTNQGKLPVPFDLNYQSYDDIMAAAAFSGWNHYKTPIPATKYTTGVTVGAGVLTVTGAVFTSASSPQFRVGDKVALTGCVNSANNAIFPVTAVTATTLTLTGLLADASTSLTVYLEAAATAYGLSLTGLTTSVAGQITRAAGSFITDGVAVGDFVTLSGMNVLANNGVAFPVTAVTATVLTITGFAADTATTGRVRQTQFLADGTILSSFVFEDAQTDVNVFQTILGAVVNKMTLSVKTNALVSGSFDVIGAKSGGTTTATVSSSVTAAPTNQPFDSFTGSLKEGGTVSAIVNGVDLSLDNGVDLKYAVFSRDGFDARPGIVNLTGNLNVYLQDAALLTKFLNETESSLDFVLTDLLGNTYEFLIPRVKYTGATRSVSEKDVSIALPFTALRDPTLGVHVLISKTAA